MQDLGRQQQDLARYYTQLPKFKAFNVFMVLFSLAQIILYSIEAADSGCPQGRHVLTK